VERQEILTTLLDEVAKATEAHKLAHAQFHATINDIPSGLPHPDGVQRISNASTACAHAREKERVSRARLQLFQVYGFIPDDLK
jgi:hypothetical protein